MSISNPIPSGQIVDFDINYGCLESPECENINNIVNTIIEPLCELIQQVGGFDPSDLNLECLEEEIEESEEGVVLKTILQALINRLCMFTESESGFDFDWTGFNVCDSDNWSCDDESQCLPLVDENNESIAVYNTKQLLRVVVRRLMGVQNYICDLEDRIETLETNYTTLESRLTIVENIQTSCCPE